MGQGRGHSCQTCSLKLGVVDKGGKNNDYALSYCHHCPPAQQELIVYLLCVISSVLGSTQQQGTEQKNQSTVQPGTVF